MHHKTRESAIKKYAATIYESVAVLADVIKSENPEYTIGEIVEIINGIQSLKESPKGSVSAAIENAVSKIEMKPYDMWRGELVMTKDRKIAGTSQREITEMQFQFIDAKPKRTGITMPYDKYEFWNLTHFTARKQVTDMLFPAGIKQDLYFRLNDDTEKFEMIIRELETV